MNDFSTTEIIKKITSIKDRVSGLDRSGRLFYEIWAFIPTTSDEYQLFYKGNNKTEKIADKFSNELDAILNDSGVVKIKITLKDSRKHLGDMEMTLKNAYASTSPAIRPIILNHSKEIKDTQDKFDYQQSQQNNQQAQNNSLGGVDMLFGLLNPEVDERQYGLLGGIIKLREKTIEDKYEKQRQEDRLEKYIEENGVLKNNLGQKELELKALQAKIDKSEERISDLEDELSEYEKMNPNRDMISGIGGNILGKAILKLSDNPKFSGLFGMLMDDDSPAQVEDLSAAPTEFENVNIEAVDDSPRGKAVEEINSFLKKMGDDNFVDLYSLLVHFSSNPADINACLSYVKNEQ